MQRRDFLSTAALAAGLVPAVLAQDAPKTADPLGLVQLTKDIKCSRIGYGTGMRGSNRVSDTVRAGWAKSIELLRFAYDNGIRFFDCADLYGTHAIVAEALKGKPRDSYTVVSKIWLHGGGLPEKERLSPEETVPRFLRELGTDYIDVLQIHCMMNNNWTTQFAAAMESMEKLKKQGKIRAHGISSHLTAATKLAAETPWCDTVHIRINSEGMNMDGPQNDAEARVKEGVAAAEAAHKAGKGIIAMKVLGEGKMSDKPDLRKKSAAFVSKLDCVDVMIVGFTEKEHITEFIENVKNA